MVTDTTFLVYVFTYVLTRVTPYTLLNQTFTEFGQVYESVKVSYGTVRRWKILTGTAVVKCATKAGLHVTLKSKTNVLFIS